MTENPSSLADASGNKTKRHYWILRCRAQLDWEELWDWFCFEHGALGTEIRITETGQESHAYFLEKDSQTLKNLHLTFNESVSGGPHVVQFLELIQSQEEDWQSNWKPFFQPIQIGEVLEVTPPWLRDQKSSNRTRILIDPGRGFGTGHHLSTSLALELLESLLKTYSEKPQWLLDFGTGSGILSIAACKLGCQKSIALDYDEGSMSDVVRNVQLNGLENQIFPMQADQTCLSKKFPVIISNMLLAELKRSASDLAYSLEPDGTLLCSGILDEQVKELEETFRIQDFVPSRNLTREGWSAIEFQRAFSKLATTIY